MNHSRRRVAGAAALVLGLAVTLVACAPAPPAAPSSAPAAPARSTAAPAAQPATAATAPAGGAATAAPVPLNPPAQVKVGYIGTVAERGLFIGLERGYFAEEGLDVELVTSRP